MIGVGRENNGGEAERTSSVRCVECGHFRYFANAREHNSPHALGECLAEPWDGSQGQWPVLHHSCRKFAPRAPDPVPETERTF